MLYIRVNLHGAVQVSRLHHKELTVASCFMIPALRYSLDFTPYDDKLIDGIRAWYRTYISTVIMVLRPP